MESKVKSGEILAYQAAEELFLGFRASNWSFVETGLTTQFIAILIALFFKK
jgi:hypothetical protein